jgi:hypothetical protein
VKGSVIEVGTDYDKPCTPSYLACSYKSLPSSVKKGSQMLVADGAMMLEVGVRITELHKIRLFIMIRYPNLVFSPQTYAICFFFENVILFGLSCTLRSPRSRLAP